MNTLKKNKDKKKKINIKGRLDFQILSNDVIKNLPLACKMPTPVL